MTLKRLAWISSRIEYLSRMLRKKEKQLAELECQLGISAVNPDGMPHVKGDTDGPVVRLVLKREKLIDEILKKQAEIDALHDTLEKALSSVTDCELRRILEYRYKEGLTWARTAERISGDENTGESIRNRCKRYFRTGENH